MINYQILKSSHVNSFFLCFSFCFTSRERSDLDVLDLNVSEDLTD